MFLHAFQSEWLKRKRSFASLMVVGGALFTPAIILVVRLIHHRGLPALYATETFWPKLWSDAWESMAVFFLPLGAMLATSLITQIEFRSNAWKQAHVLPMRTITLFSSKLAVILVVMAEFLLLFIAGIYISAMLPAILLPGVPMPKGSFASLPILRESAFYFLECLPIVGAQYLMALRSHNVLVPIGIGFAAWVGALAAVSSKVAIWWPYSYTIIHYLRDTPKGAALAGRPTQWLAMAFFALLTVAAYALFAGRSEKG